jgi:hypothetical protein
MKLTLLIAGVLMSFQAFAGGFAIEKNAVSFKGFSGVYGNEDIKGCKYLVSVNGTEVGVFINSDEETSINGAIFLDKADIPLKEGVVRKTDEIEVTYEKGVLKAVEKKTWGGPLTFDKVITEFVVSPNLQKIKSAHTATIKAGIFSKETVQELTCQF